MNDNELFELCKEVYELFPEWKTEQVIEFYHDVSGHLQLLGPKSYQIQPDYNHCVPLYTSDYLLEKLPKETRFGTPQLIWYAGHWEACYTDAVDSLWNQELKSHAGDTPLKALLKLTLALKNAGEL